ncbi:MAG: ankyrin repeat domain-containing protein [Kamptonema sp. SIO1D9]|nr:ankyrin repeat domain-containing protein [Kamptonema sp. SIO1D9]
MSANHQNIPLFFSLIKEGNLAQVSELIQLGYDVNEQFEEGVTPAIQAASYGHLEILKTLVKAGADVNIVDQQLESPLMVARIKGHQEVINYLIPLTNQEIREIVEQQLTE